MQTVKFFTLGCKVNQYDTQELRERFIRCGFQELTNGRKADIYVINTCTVTSSADRKSRHLIHDARRHNPRAKIIVTGCYTELNEREIAKISGVTHIVRSKNKDKIFDLLNGHNAQNELPLYRQAGTNTNAGGITNFHGHTRVFLKIQDGCDNFCAYCKVPLVRGALKSKPLDKIRGETSRLVESGFKEIVLCGICLGAFGRDLKNRIDLVDAIEALEGIEGLMRIRLSSIEANDISDRLVAKLAKSNFACRQRGKLCRHLHIPLQSGDDEILEKMHRKVTRQDYSALIRTIKNSVPGIAVTTDVLVGFPGEDEVNFENTLSMVKEILPLRVHIFPYSPREGTAAYSLKNRINPIQIKERILRLQNIAHTLSCTYKRQFIGQDMEVLIEGRSKENEDCWEGYADNYIKTWVKSEEDLRNQLIRVKLEKISGDSMEAVFY
ncbi:MAG: tRNA (N(6)-L-threonylcarbamoyladenosine(37)-C(2))-methylthiotransferase MtaB [Candidatus Omnitrophota bacterium]